MNDHHRPISELATTVAAECLAVRLRRLNRVVSRLYDDHLRPHGLRTTQFNLLVGIAVAAPVSPSDLAGLLDLEKSTMSRNVRLMETNGWITLDPHDHNRGKLLRLTDTGESVLRQAYPAWAAAQARLNAATDGRRNTRKLLDGLIRAARSSTA